MCKGKVRVSRLRIRKILKHINFWQFSIGLSVFISRLRLKHLKFNFIFIHFILYTRYKAKSVTGCYFYNWDMKFLFFINCLMSTKLTLLCDVTFNTKWLIENKNFKFRFVSYIIACYLYTHIYTTRKIITDIK